MKNGWELAAAVLALVAIWALHKSNTAATGSTVVTPSGVVPFTPGPANFVAGSDPGFNYGSPTLGTSGGLATIG